MSKPVDRVQGSLALRIRTWCQRDRVEPALDEEFRFHIGKCIEMETGQVLVPRQRAKEPQSLFAHGSAR